MERVAEWNHWVDDDKGIDIWYKASDDFKGRIDIELKDSQGLVHRIFFQDSR